MNSIMLTLLCIAGPGLQDALAPQEVPKLSAQQTRAATINQWIDLGKKEKDQWLSNVPDVFSKSGFLDREDVAVLLREIKIQSDYVIETNRAIGGAMPPGLDQVDESIQNLRRDPYFLPSSIKLLEGLYAVRSLALFIERDHIQRGNAQMSPRINALLSRWSSHVFALSEIYEMRVRTP